MYCSRKVIPKTKYVSDEGVRYGTYSQSWECVWVTKSLNLERAAFWGSLAGLRSICGQLLRKYGPIFTLLFRSYCARRCARQFYPLLVQALEMQTDCLNLFTNLLTTFSNGYLGSRNDEERSKLRYVVWIAKLSESSKFWTHFALHG